MLDKKPHQVPSFDEVLAGDFSFQDEAPAKEVAVPPPKESPRVLAVALTEGGVKIIGRGRVRVLGPMISPNGGGQFGRTGQGGGASGGKAKPKRGSGAPKPAHPDRFWWGGVAKERHESALDINLKKFVERGGDKAKKVEKKAEKPRGKRRDK